MLDFPIHKYGRVQKEWGDEYILCNNRQYCAKILALLPDSTSSYHYHNKKHETFILWEGSCWMEIEGVKKRLKQGMKVVLKPKTKHRFYNAQDFKKCYILEISTTHSDEDVVRIRKSKGTSKIFVDNSSPYQPASVRMLGV